MKKQKKKQKQNKIYLIIIFILLILLNKNIILKTFKKIDLTIQKNNIIECLELNAKRQDINGKNYIEQLNNDLQNINQQLKDL